MLLKILHLDPFSQELVRVGIEFDLTRIFDDL